MGRINAMAYIAATRFTVISNTFTQVISNVFIFYG